MFACLRSTNNQKAVIAEYARSHDFEVVQTYSDEARSGIDLGRWPGLKRLLDDITTSKADYRAVLVFHGPDSHGSVLRCVHVGKNRVVMDAPELMSVTR